MYCHPDSWDFIFEKTLSTPPPTRDLVLKKVRRCFIDENVATQVVGTLDLFGAESSEAGRARVHLAILKQCNGEVERVRKLVELACTDFRDVLVGAEFPEEFSLPSGADDINVVRERDRRQYEDWLNAD